MEHTIELRPANTEAGAAHGAACRKLTLAIPAMMCGVCVRTIEDTLMAAPGVGSARANLSEKRVHIGFDPARTNATALIETLRARGFTSGEFFADSKEPWADRTRELLPRVGVAGFAAANIMLLSVSVWSGTDMDSSIQALFHRISALIAIPAIAYSGQPFFKSALSALKGRRLNMDVPISLGILLATAMSIFQTIRGTEQVYFDAAVTLVFFLLIGRTLDEQMRSRVRGAAANLLSLSASTAELLRDDGSVTTIPARELQPGNRVLIAAGSKIPGDGTVLSGESDIDEALMTGETSPRAVGSGDRVYAGTVNGTQSLRIEITAVGEDTLLAEISRAMVAAEQTRGRYVRLADRAARLYAPAVHLLGLSTFVGWMFAGAGWEQALTNAIAVLIITCPCALALAVPAVQVAATGRLFRQGIIIKSADGLERIAETDTIVFDKTGTLTTGALRVRNADAISDCDLCAAASLAISSLHPYAKAVVKAARERKLAIGVMSNVREAAGAGLSAITPDGEVRLGSARFTGTRDNGRAGLWYAWPGKAPISFEMEDRLKVDSSETAAALIEAGYELSILSGDRPEAVAAAARAIGIKSWQGDVRPVEKCDRIAALKASGRKVLMIGDGLNDAPALAAGHASLSPSTAVEISQTAADGIFQGDNLRPVIETINVARAAQRMALQNFAIAILYNAAFVPLAAFGYVTPLIAAAAMSSSSILVTANAVRLRSMRLRLTPFRSDPK